MKENETFMVTILYGINASDRISCLGDYLHLFFQLFTCFEVLL